MFCEERIQHVKDGTKILVGKEVPLSIKERNVLK